MNTTVLTSIYISIQEVKWMPIDTVCFPGIVSSDCLPPKSIYTRCGRLQMFWIHTSSIAAKVIECKSIGNRSYKHFIGESVGTMATSPIIKSSIAIFGNIPYPNPTLVRRKFLYPSPKTTLFRRILSQSFLYGKRIAVLMHSFIMSSAITKRIMLPTTGSNSTVLSPIFSIHAITIALDI